MGQGTYLDYLIAGFVGGVVIYIGTTYLKGGLKDIGL